MAFVNLPPNLQDMFYALSDRIAKLETGPNQPGYDADAAQATAVSAQSVASQATTAANLANTQATTAIALANTKNTVFYSGSAPTANAVNDQWINTAQGNKLYIWNGSSWVSAQDSAISAAQSTANGKNAIYRQGTTPTTPYTGTQFIIGDMWFNTASDNAISTWNGTSWTSNALGNSALYGNISANKLTSGTIDASVINVSNINAGNISTGTLSASRIATGSLNANVITSNTITATQIAAGTITATEISSSYVYAGTIQATQIYAGTLTGFTINNGSGTFSVSSAGSMVATSGHIGNWYITSGNLTDSSGTSTVLSATGSTMLSGYGTVVSGSGIYVGSGSYAVSLTTSGISTTGSLSSGGTADITGNLQVHAMSSTSATGVVWSSSNSRFYLTTSTERHKDNITPIPAADYLSKILELEPVTFNYKPEYTDNPNQLISGLIAERVAAIPEFLTTVNLDKDGLPESIAYDRLVVFLIPALKQINDRLNKLEGK